MHYCHINFWNTLTLTLILTLNPEPFTIILSIILVTTCNANTPSNICAAAWRLRLSFTISFTAGTITYMLFLRLPDEQSSRKMLGNSAPVERREVISREFCFIASVESRERSTVSQLTLACLASQISGGVIRRHWQRSSTGRWPSRASNVGLLARVALTHQRRDRFPVLAAKDDL